MKKLFFKIILSLCLMVGLVFLLILLISNSHNRAVDVELVEVGSYLKVPFQVRRSGFHTMRLEADVKNNPGLSYYAALKDVMIEQDGGPTINLDKSSLNKYRDVELIEGKKYVFNAKVIDYDLVGDDDHIMGKDDISQLRLHFEEPDSGFIKFMKKFIP